MPSNFEIDPIRRVVIFRVSGALTMADMIETRRRLKDDPTFNPGFDQINDLRAVSEVAMSADQLRQAAGQSAFAPQARVAIVARRDNPVTFGMVRMYELLRTAGDPGRVGIFDSMENAAAWLGLPDAPGP